MELINESYVVTDAPYWYTLELQEIGHIHVPRSAINFQQYENCCALC